MKLLDVINNIELCDNNVVNNMIEALSERRDNVEANEPLSDGSYYNKWEEKLSELNQLIEDLEEVVDTEDLEERNKMLQQIRVDLIFHQFTYGGLKRLII